MKVHFLGNVCNNHYVIVRGLRQLGIDAHLFLSPVEFLHHQTLPESEDPDLLASGYPSWIHKMPRISPLHPLHTVPRKFRPEVLACDLIHSHGNLADSIMSGNTPYVIHPYGGDFFLIPFDRPLGLRWIHPYFWGRRHRIKRAYRNASAVIIGTWNPLWMKGYNELLVGKKIAPIPLAIDTDKFRYGYKSQNIFKKLFPKHDFFIFQTARHCWTKETVLKEGGDKGNDILIRSFSLLVKTNKRALLIFIDDRGGDCRRSKELNHILKITRNVRWLEPMSRFALIPYLHSSDIFVDSLRTTYGSAALEAMSCGVPVIMNCPTERYNLMFGSSPPILNVNDNVKDTTSMLVHCFVQSEELYKVSLKQRRFLEEHHSQRVVCHRILTMYESILGYRSSFKYVTQDIFV